MNHQSPDRAGGSRCSASDIADQHVVWSVGMGAPARLLQLGLAFVFVYAASSTLVDPAAYGSYLPRSLRDRSLTDALLRAFALYEMGLAGALLIARFRRRASLMAALTLLAILAVNMNSFAVLFRNVAIAFAALALASMSPEPHRTVLRDLAHEQAVDIHELRGPGIPAADRNEEDGDRGHRDGVNGLLMPISPSSREWARHRAGKCSNGRGRK